MPNGSSTVPCSAADIRQQRASMHTLSAHTAEGALLQTITQRGAGASSLPQARAATAPPSSCEQRDYRDDNSGTEHPAKAHMQLRQSGSAHVTIADSAAAQLSGSHGDHTDPDSPDQTIEQQDVAVRSFAAVPPSCKSNPVDIAPLVHLLEDIATQLPSSDKYGSLAEVATRRAEVTTDGALHRSSTSVSGDSSGADHYQQQFLADVAATMQQQRRIDVAANAASICRASLLADSSMRHDETALTSGATNALHPTDSAAGHHVQLTEADTATTDQQTRLVCAITLVDYAGKSHLVDLPPSADDVSSSSIDVHRLVASRTGVPYDRFSLVVDGKPMVSSTWTARGALVGAVVRQSLRLRGGSAAAVSSFSLDSESERSATMRQDADGDVPSSSQVGLNEWLEAILSQSTSCGSPILRKQLEKVYSAIVASNDVAFMEQSKLRSKIFVIASPDLDEYGVDKILTDPDKQLWLMRQAHIGAEVIRSLPMVTADSAVQFSRVASSLGAFPPLQTSLSVGSVHVIAYSGHGISRAQAVTLNQPGVSEDIWKYQSARTIPPTSLLGAIPPTTRDSQGKGVTFSAGDGMQIEPLRFFRFRDLLAFWPNGAGADPHNFLVVVMDSCNSGAVAETLGNILSEVSQQSRTGRTLNARSAILVQHACRADEPAYPGYFTPTFMRLQSRQTRKELAVLYQLEMDMPGFLRPELMPTKADPPWQHVGVHVHQVEALPVPNLASHRELYLEYKDWPVVLITDPYFFDFCHRIFTATEQQLTLARGPQGFTRDYLASLMQQLTAHPMLVEPFNYWLKKARDGTKLAIIP